MSLPSVGFVKTIQIIKKTGGEYVDGRYVEGSFVETNISANVQRLTMRERELLSSGYQSHETYKIYLDPQAIALIKEDFASVEEADSFRIDGDIFDQIASEEWYQFIPHWKITVVKREENYA